MEASVFHPGIRFHFLENYLFSRRFSGPEKGLAEQVSSDFVSPIAPGPAGDGRWVSVAIGRRDR